MPTPDSRDARGAFRQGHRLLGRGQWDKARKAFEAGAEADPRDPRPLVWAAQAAGEAGQAAEARRLVNQALKRSGDSAAILVLAARALLDAGQYGDARKIAGRARKADPANPLARGLVALTLLAEDKYAEAAELLDGAEIPESTGFQCRLMLELERALCRTKADPPKLAGPLRIKPRTYRILPVLCWVQECWYNYRHARLQRQVDRLACKGKVLKAWRLLDPTLVADSRFDPGQGPLMSVIRPALEELRGMSGSERFSNQKRLELVRLAGMAGDLEFARKQLHQLRRGSAAGGDLAIDLDWAEGLVQFWSEQYQPAAAAFQAVIKQFREETSAWHFLGVCQLRLDQPAKARQAFTECCHLEPWRVTQALNDFAETLNERANVS